MPLVQRDLCLHLPDHLRLGQPPSQLSSGSSASPTFSRLTQWMLAHKDRLDRLLEIELRAEDAGWMIYSPEEAEIKAQMADEIWQLSIDQALQAMLSSRAASKKAILALA
ncbi:unnamed protein product [Protopolystoma xenopodis]|uniref:Uncharacterized protein n=1 Tax=Protopolystoma xenopodis TaxID=117903 RepID=A0A448WTB9_9PLAT|nr:unnamed protein product [Protopolystoma xenopodis]